MGDFMKTLLILIAQILFFILFAPLFSGWIKWFKCHLQNRTAPSVLQPYKNLRKLFHKEALSVSGASWIFYATPYILFTTTVLISSLIPCFAITALPYGLGDAIVLVGLLALARFFLALAGLDLGTTFGGMGSSREMMISALAEPALLLVFFTLAINAGSSNLATLAGYAIESKWSIYVHPSLIFACLALIMVTLAETGRIPIDNPTTHLELTMIHEAMILEYSGKYLGLIEWAAQIKTLFFFVLICTFFFPHGITMVPTAKQLIISLAFLIGKLFICSIVLALVETALAKMRLFKAPYFLGVAFALCLLGILCHILLEVN